MPATPVVLFTDFVCPFSYVTEIGLRRVLPPNGGDLELRAFELYPVPAPPPMTLLPAEVEAALHPLAEEAGVVIRRPDRVPRSRKAHEAVHFARTQGREAALRDALYRAYWAEGRDIGRIDVLTAIAGEVGLPPDELRIALDIDTFADAVHGDRRLAEHLGVRHTPTLIVGTGGDSRVWVGALTLTELRRALAPDGGNPEGNA